MYDEDLYRCINSTPERFDGTICDRLVPVAWSVTCIMYMHNELSEKIIVTLLERAFPYAKHRNRNLPTKLH